MDDRGNTVIVWESVSHGADSVRARTVSSTGHLGAVVNVATGDFGTDPVTGDEHGTQFLSPSVAMNRSRGSFVVAYTKQNIDDSADGSFSDDTTDLVVTEVSFSGGIRGTFQAGEMTVDPSMGLVYDGHPAVSIDGTGHYIDTYCNVSDGITGTSAVLLRKGRLS
jgi:hypothetical protein